MSEAPRIPTLEVVEQAREAARALGGVLVRTKAQKLEITTARSKSRSIVVPREALELFLEVLGQMANGNAVTIMPVHAELTTQQAAEMLNVSRPHVVKLLEEGTIPFRKVGVHRRIRVADLLAYKQRVDEDSRRMADELTQEAEDLGLGY